MKFWVWNNLFLLFCSSLKSFERKIWDCATFIKAWKYHFFMKVPEIINAPSLTDYDEASAIKANISLYMYYFVHSSTAWHLNDWWTKDSWESNLWEFCYLTAFVLSNVWDIFMVIDFFVVFYFGACFVVCSCAWLMRMIMRPIIVQHQWNGLYYSKKVRNW